MTIICRTCGCTTEPGPGHMCPRTPSAVTERVWRDPEHPGFEFVEHTTGAGEHLQTVGYWRAVTV